ncbi:MAG TPA: Ppx/GppA phosphatase family protein [Steroidobacteraceae bacterium]|jgi:exopolyphosphatase/guanosine-5'-triphosphate,3'-diphosphate pyrophosphatase|nr:Ppx/GppA phosphatase family protein [Steroidobacteraceae bacterium]
MSRRRVVPDVLAAVDLGSNSFHMVVARYSHGQLVILDRLREMVRLAAGLGDSGRLDDAATDRALRCLERFGQRLRAMRADGVRVVGTNALRRARRKRWFLERARAALGHPIEIISGLEEARLIYSGVAHTSPMSPDKRLVIDIGGGSTEAVIGQGFDPLLLESLSVGCVGLSASYFDDGRISAKRLERARTAVRLELEPIQEAYRKLGWLQAFGSSGTVRVIGDVLHSLNPEAPHITLDNLNGLAERVIAAGHVDELDLPEVDAERAPVFPAGLAILLEVVENFGIDRVRVAEGAMREGLLYDLMGRFTNEDARVRSVRAMEKRYQIDVTQAERVELTAVALLEQVESEWGLEDPLAELVLRWAARLHETGLDIAHSKYHRHSAYLLENADMPGFPREEQQLLAALVGGHRRQLSFESLEDLLPPWDRLAEFLIVLLRLAVLLHRGRSPQPLPEVRLSAKGRNLTLELPPRWIKEHPLTLEDLQQEQQYLKDAGFRLSIVQV